MVVWSRHSSEVTSCFSTTGYALRVWICPSCESTPACSHSNSLISLSVDFGAWCNPAGLQVSPEYPYRVGDIVVFKLAGRDIPIVHRVLKVHEKDDGDVDLLTKGDNNKVDDRGLYNTGQKWLNKEHVIGRARGYLPYVGMVTIIMNDYPMFKCASMISPRPLDL